MHEDIDTYAKWFTGKLIDLDETCIPNKIVTLQQLEPPWIKTYIKRLNRKYKRAYKMQNEHIWLG